MLRLCKALLTKQIEPHAQRFELLGQQVDFNHLTTFENDLDLRQLPLGTLLEISGFHRANGSLLATRISLDHRPIQQYKIKGQISRISPRLKQFQIEDLIVGYASANFVGLSQDDLTQGLLITVKGNPQDYDLSKNRLQAQRIEVRTFQPEDNTHLNLEGFIDYYVNRDDFAVNGIPVSVSDDTRWIGGSHGKDLSANILVKVQGQLNRRGVLIADQMKIVHGRPVRVRGSIENIDRSRRTLRVQQVPFIVPEQTQIRDTSYIQSRFIQLNALNANDRVILNGYIKPDGQFVAGTIERENRRADLPQEIYGPISRLTPTGFVLLNQPIIVNPTTELKGELNTRDDLRVGMTVSVGVRDVANGIVAKTVE